MKSYSGRIHFWPNIPLSPQVSKGPAEARGGDVILFQSGPGEAGPI